MKGLVVVDTITTYYCFLLLGYLIMADAKFYDSVIRAIIQYLSNSELSKENFLHARNTLQWLEFFCQDVDDITKIAALGHDLECSLQNRLQLADYSSYSAYRDVVAAESAKLMDGIMQKCEADDVTTKKVCYLIEHINDNNPSEERTYILGNADAISFLDVGLFFYCKHSNEKTITERCEWEYKRLSGKAKEQLQKFYFYDNSINKYITELAKRTESSLTNA